MAYVDTKMLEANWSQCLLTHPYHRTNSRRAWKTLSDDVYKICRGVATQFHPQSEDELDELAHHAFAHTMGKIRAGTLTFTPGRAPVFNLLTTAVFRCLYTHKTTEKRKNSKIVKYGRRAFENLSHFNEPQTGRILTCRTPLVKYYPDQKSNSEH